MKSIEQFTRRLAYKLYGQIDQWTDRLIPIMPINPKFFACKGIKTGDKKHATLRPNIYKLISRLKDKHYHWQEYLLENHIYFIIEMGYHSSHQIMLAFWLLRFDWYKGKAFFIFLKMCSWKRWWWIASDVPPISDILTNINWSCTYSDSNVFKHLQSNLPWVTFI